MSTAREPAPMPLLQITEGRYAGRSGTLVRRGDSTVTVDLGMPVDGGSGIITVPASSVRDDDGLDGWDDETVGDSTSSVNLAPVWQVGDRVRIVSGPPALVGAVGAVVAVDVPGRHPIRVAVEGRRGFGEVLCAADELAPEGAVGGGAAS